MKNYLLIFLFICVFNNLSAQLFGGQIKTNKNWANSYPAGSVFCAGGPTAIVDVTNPITGKVWMDRNLGASQVATSSTDANAYGDLYQWGRRSDGHQCRTSSTTSTLSSVDAPSNGNFILVLSSSPGDWRNPQNSNLWQGANGINNPCPNGYRLPTQTEFNLEKSTWSSNSNAGAFGAPIKLLAAGGRASSIENNGSILTAGIGGVYWTSTTSNNTSVNLTFGTLDPAFSGSNLCRADGNSVRCIKEAVATVGAINCGSATNTGTLTASTAASGVSSSVPYTGGNAGSHSGQTVTSTGVTGLTATLAAGSFANGAGTLIYNITGTPSASGTASFALNIGGQTCILSWTVSSNLAAQYPAGSVFCASGPTPIVEVTNPTTGKIWMDRNLGASQVATSSTDANAYGDLYQWGRRSDGHQCRTSATTTNLSSSDQPNHGDFILAANSPYDWRSPQNNNLWQGVNGINNPCPIGYRIPSDVELEEERLSWSTNNSNGAFNSILRITRASIRNNVGSISTNTSTGYWSSGYYLYISNASSSTNNWTYSMRANGLPVRCIKN